VLIASARRCCLCFGLNGDFSEKKGQIAHIDQEPANQRDDNLVFPCLDHHDAFDSCTSQSKGLTREEVEFYKDKLFEAVQTKLPGRVSKDISVSAELEAVTTFFRALRRLDLFAGSMLSGYEIQQAHAADLLGIDPFVHDHLTWSGYRLSSGNEGVVDGHLVKFSKDQPLMLEPNAFAAVSTEEVLALPPWLGGEARTASGKYFTFRFIHGQSFDGRSRISRAPVRNCSQSQSSLYYHNVADAVDNTRTLFP
jgi:hypothetical protein